MSPEQAAGDREHLGPRSDVYSLGATLYCLLTGKPPFEGEAGDVLRAVQKGAFPPPRWLDLALDKALEAVCLKAMALKPEDRYATPKALAEDVERWMADEPVTSWRESLPRRARRWARRNRTMVTAALATFLAATLGLAVVLAVQTRANRDLTRANRGHSSERKKSYVKGKNWGSAKSPVVNPSKTVPPKRRLVTFRRPAAPVGLIQTSQIPKIGHATLC